MFRNSLLVLNGDSDKQLYQTNTLHFHLKPRSEGRNANHDGSMNNLCFCKCNSTYINKLTLQKYNLVF